VPGRAEVVVITGASSGIGRATAIAFARRQSSLVLAARNEQGLHQAAEECRSLGARVLVKPTDVSKAPQVEALGRASVAEFGRIDVWVNNASVLLFGSFEAIPEEDFRRVMETNLFGYLHGARVALRQFRAQGDRGSLINIASVLARVGEPYVSAYVTSKFAIRGWSASLRQEVLNTPGIHVCTVLPSPFDTPIYQKAGNYFGRQGRSIWPVGDPMDVAAAVVHLVEYPRREIVVGGFGRLLSLADSFAPGLLERAIARYGPPLQFSEEPTNARSGNISEAHGPFGVSGGWREYWRRRMGRLPELLLGKRRGAP
jgi:NAD(P)-dependent dehydrogenase (short-subunit alcohol dehydrogenase family)